MQRITVLVLREDAPAAAVVLAQRGSFNPEAGGSPELLPELPGKRFSELYRAARGHLDKILVHCPLSADAQAPQRALPDETELEKVEAWLRTVWVQCSNCQESLRRAEEEQRYVAQLMKMLDRFAALDIDFGLLARSRRFLDVQVGMVPSGNAGRLREAVALAGYVLALLQDAQGLAHVVIAGPKGRESEVGAVLRSADWQAARMPAKWHDDPQEARRQLLKHQDRMIAEADTRCRQVEAMQREFHGRLVEATRALAVAAPYAELGQALRGRGGLTQIDGWAPVSALPGLQRALRDRLGQRFALSTRDPRPDEFARVPSLLYHHALLRPFSLLVSNYGVPRYGEIDPTLPFAATFVLMFGMMFGDIGNGAIIAAAGISGSRRLRGFAPFVVACGLASVGFGWLYGSVFGFERLVHPLWMSPLADPVRMLTVSLYCGIGFILLVGVLTACNRIIDRRYLDALLDGRGAAGLLFYVAVLYGVYRRFFSGGSGRTQWVVAALALAVVFGYHGYRYAGQMGERILVAFTQVLEDAIGYFSNTLSFLRVAAFGLNHMALAVAVFALASMMQAGTGHWITIVLGNLFIVILEGAIVAIQALRLEYYEGFSHFFGGSGREFRPLTLAPGAAMES